MTEAEAQSESSVPSPALGCIPPPRLSQKKYIPDTSPPFQYNFKKVPISPFPRHHHHNDPLSWE